MSASHLFEPDARDDAPLDLLSAPPDPTLLNFRDLHQYVRRRAVPWRREHDGRLVLAAEDPLAATIARPVRFQDEIYASTTPAGLSEFLQTRFRDELAREAVDALRRDQPIASASRVATVTQIVGFVAALAALIAAFVAAPTATLVGFNAACTIYFLCVLIFKARLATSSLSTDTKEAPPISDLEVAGDWPTVTVLLPLYREPDMARPLIDAISSFDYPANRLDVKLILEEDDFETRDAVAAAGAREAGFDICVTPAGHPRTKPKAMNYAAQLARGDYVAIYDAEDRPEPDQLKKAVRAFRAGPKNLGCVQARLAFDNGHENWLTRQFAIEYAVLFECILPALDRAGLPIPLGGTSNIFDGVR